MGFLDSLTGGGGMLDFTYAEDMNRQSAGIWQDLFNAYQDQNAGFVSTGTGANDLLGTYLGISAPTVSRDALYRQMKDQYITGEKGGDGSGKGYWDKSGDVWNWMQDGELSGNRQKDEAGLQAAIDAEMARLTAEKQGNENFGSLLDVFSLEDFEASPSYNFNLEQGQKAIDRANASRGSYNSPAAIQELLNYSQGLASNEFNNAYTMDAQNKNSIYNMLMGTSNSGQNALNAGASQGNIYADQISGFKSNLANLDLQRQAMELQNDRDSSFLGSGIGSLLGSFGNLGSLGSSLGSLFGTGSGISSGVAALGVACDMRVKENIKRVGYADNGLPLYKFNYIGDDTPQINVMAQDVELVDPGAVTEKDGIKYVNMDRVYA